MTRKRLIVLGLGGILLLALGFYGVLSWNRYKDRKVFLNVVEQIDRESPGWRTRVDDWDRDNASEESNRFFELLSTMPTPLIQAVKDFQRTSIGKQSKNVLPAGRKHEELKTLFRQHELAIRTIEAAIPTRVHIRSVDIESANTTIFFHDLARILFHRAMIELADGQGEAVARSVQSLSLLVDFIGDCPTEIGQNLRQAFWHFEMDLDERIMNSGVVVPGDRPARWASICNSNSNILLAEAIRFETYQINEFFNGPTLLDPTTGKPAARGPLGNLMLRFEPMITDTESARTLSFQHDLVKVHRSPIEVRRQMLTDLLQRHGEEAKGLRERIETMDVALDPLILRAKLMQAAVAAESYRKANKRWPKDRDEVSQWDPKLAVVVRGCHFDNNGDALILTLPEFDHRKKPAQISLHSVGDRGRRWAGE